MSDKGAFITGSTFLIDGGATASYFYGPLKPGTKAQSLEIEKLQKAAAEKPEPEYIVYTVKAGESLEQICQQNNIDFSANKNIILAMNGIQNSNVIRVGQTVILPKLNAAKN